MGVQDEDSLLPKYNHSVSPFESDTKSRAHTPRVGLVFGDELLEQLQAGDLAKTRQGLPQKDRVQFLVLVVLYLIQGIPFGLAFGSIPFLLKSSSNLSYSQLGFFSLASYPYSFKLVYSPIVDSIFHPKIGRRKSWIIPVQLISGITLLVLSTRVELLLSNIEHSLVNLTLAFFVLIFLCATQDIAVDGWALTILSPQLLSYASTAQTVGLNCGYFLSFTVFLAFNSPEFANKYLRSTPLDYGLISLPGYLRICGLFFIFVTFIVAVYIPEHPFDDSKRSDDIELTNPYERSLLESSSSVDNLRQVYIKMYQVLKLPNVRIFILLHLISKIGFQANEALTNLKLLEKGLSKEDLAITVLIDFPFEIIFGYYAGRWSTGDEPLKPWLYLFLGRILAAVLGEILIINFPEKVSASYFFLVILQHLLGSFMSTVQFVSICAFHTKIADPLIGGTYMTTLNTLSNLGGQWPKIIVLNMIDRFTVAHCESDNDLFANEFFYQCNTLDLKAKCIEAGGDCHVLKDGYLTTNMICICIGLLTFFLWIRNTVKYLQRLPQQSWRIRAS